MKTGIAIALLGSLAVAASAVEAAEKFQKLSGSQIRARIAGMEMTDDVHWREIYERNGMLISHSMGRRTTGTWRVEKDELCVERGKNEGGCYQVWVAGKKVELRRQGSGVVSDGVLERPGARRQSNP